jgi:hypothetical protein
MIPSLSEQKSKVFVAGLSWAMGEWQGPEVQHGGIQEYFAEAGYKVINSAKPRVYHQRINQILDQKLTESYQPGDLIFWVQADPLLDLIVPERTEMGILKSRASIALPNFSQQIQSAGGIKQLILKQQNTIYQELNAIAAKHNTQVYCIGGTFNINQHVVKPYTQLTAVAPSWINLLIGHLREHPDTANTDFGVVHTWDLGYVDLATYDTTFADQVKLELKELTDNLQKFNELIFHPDGLHPNREGHKILFDHIVKELNL